MKNRITSIFEYIFAFIKQVIFNLSNHRILLYAASLAYFGLFSLFPLLLFLIYLGSQFLEIGASREILASIILDFFPIELERVNFLIENTLSLRRSIGFIGFAGLIWSGSSVFGVMELSLSEIFNCPRRTFWKRRLLMTGAVLTMGLVFLASYFILPLAAWLLSGQSKFFGAFASFIIGWTFLTLTNYIIYRIFPTRKLKWRIALTGAGAGALLIEISRSVFIYYLELILIRYGSVYGSLAWIAALGIWTYVVGVLFFVGAEITATIDSLYN